MKFLLFALSVFYVHIASAQKKAVTETGDEVILYENGTWKYSNDFREPKLVIKTNPTEFKKSNAATFLLKSKKGNVGFWIDPKKWSFGKGSSNKSAEYELSLRDESVSAVIINEEVEIPLESLKQVAIDNAKESAPDFHVIHEEYRNVNGLKVLYLQSEGTVSGIKFYFKGYYYTGVGNTTQFLVVGYKSLLNKFQKQEEELLNGLVLLKTGSTAVNMDDPGKEDSKDSLTHGSLSVNRDCRKYFAGKWEYDVRDQKVIVERTINKTTEIIGKYRFEYENKWLGDCLYEIIFRKTSQPNYKGQKVGEKIKVDILAINNEVMVYQTLYKGQEVSGEMVRSKIN